MTNGRYPLSGAAAGAASAFAFAAIHQLFIMDIWFSLVPMMIAGAICGLSLAWTYGLLFEHPSLGSWLRYNAAFVILLALLAVASLLFYEPITTIPVLIAAKEPPIALFRGAMPLTIGFTLGAAALLSLSWGRTLLKFSSILVTCTIVVLLLGLNVSAIGFVELPSGTAYLIVELFGLILALASVYAAGVLLLERRTLLRR